MSILHLADSVRALAPPQSGQTYGPPTPALPLPRPAPPHKSACIGTKQQKTCLARLDLNYSPTLSQLLCEHTIRTLPLST